MSAVGALFADTDGTEGQVEIVHQNKHVLNRDFLLLEPVAYGVAAEVHVCRGLEEYHLGGFNATFGYETIAFVLPAGIDGCSKGIDHHKTDVMARTCVLVADISKSDNKEFHVKLKIKN